MMTDEGARAYKESHHYTTATTHRYLYLKFRYFASSYNSYFFIRIRAAYVWLGRCSYLARLWMMRRKRRATSPAWIVSRSRFFCCFHSALCFCFCFQRNCRIIRKVGRGKGREFTCDKVWRLAKRLLLCEVLERAFVKPMTCILEAAWCDSRVRKSRSTWPGLAYI